MGNFFKKRLKISLQPFLVGGKFLPQGAEGTFERFRVFGHIPAAALGWGIKLKITIILKINSTCMSTTLEILIAFKRIEERNIETFHHIS